MLKRFFDNICAVSENNVLHITIPGFLRETDLKLSIYKVKNHFVLHDNGCALKSLSTRIDSIRMQKVLDLLWDKSNLQDNKLFTQIADVKFVLYFIQEVILTANADLYYEYFKEEHFGHRRYIDPCKAFESEERAEDFDTKLYRAMPPLYRVKPKKGKAEYIYDDKALEAYRKKHGNNFDIQRYKGLGEMDSEQLWETTMNPKTRKLKQIGMQRKCCLTRPSYCFTTF